MIFLGGQSEALAAQSPASGGRQPAKKRGPVHHGGGKGRVGEVSQGGKHQGGRQTSRWADASHESQQLDVTLDEGGEEVEGGAIEVETNGSVEKSLTGLGNNDCSIF